MNQLSKEIQEVITEEDWDKITTGKRFLNKIKEFGITYSGLRPILFGNAAIKFIKIIRKHEDDRRCFPAMKKYYLGWYMTKVALTLFINKR